MSKTRRKLLRWTCPVTLSVLITCSGCRKDDKSSAVISLEGKVDKITLTSDDTGEILVRYYSEKHKEEVVGKGEVTKETEILINGVVSTLKDIREGERIHGDVRVERKRGEKKLTVLKIIVERPKPVGGG